MNSKQRDGAIWCAHSFSILGGISSGPVALFVSRFRRTARTSSGESITSERVRSDGTGGLSQVDGRSLPDTIDKK